MELINLYRDPKRVTGAIKMAKIGKSIFRCQNLNSLSPSLLRFPKIPVNNGRLFRNLQNLLISGGFGYKKVEYKFFQSDVPQCRMYEPYFLTTDGLP